jgi:hypothetical protein
MKKKKTINEHMQKETNKKRRKEERMDQLGPL